MSNIHGKARSLPFGCSRLKACRQRLIKNSPGLLPALVMRKCNFLNGLLLVNLQAATLINTIQTNVSQRCHSDINHSDISFLTAVWSLAASPARAGERRRGRGGEGRQWREIESNKKTWRIIVPSEEGNGLKQDRGVIQCCYISGREKIRR